MKVRFFVIDAKENDEEKLEACGDICHGANERDRSLCIEENNAMCAVKNENVNKGV